MPAFRFRCRNVKCGSEFHRMYTNQEFEDQQYGSRSGWCCFNCGTERMGVIRSNRSVKDTFQPGYQRNIGKFCRTYQEYKAHLKNMGLVEIGYEDLPPEKENTDTRDYWTDDLLKELYQEDGINLDGQLVEALKKGEVV